MDSHLDEIKPDTDIPASSWLIGMEVGMSRPLALAFVIFFDNAPLVTAALGPQHQHGRGDPEEENDGFGHEPECGARARATGERIRIEVVGD